MDVLRPHADDAELDAATMAAANRLIKRLDPSSTHPALSAPGLPARSAGHGYTTPLTGAQARAIAAQLLAPVSDRRRLCSPLHANKHLLPPDYICSSEVPRSSWPCATRPS